MNHKQKLGYMALGAGILAVGIIIGQWGTPDIEAQSNGVFDKITCREIEVVDKDGETTILVGDGDIFFHKGGGTAFMGAHEHGGSVLIHGKGGSIEIRTHEDGGIVRVSRDDGIASMFVTEDGGIVVVSGKDSGSAKMGIDEHGGRVEVFNNQGKNRATMGVNAFGNGAVSTWDRNGYRQ